MATRLKRPPSPYAVRFAAAARHHLNLPTDAKLSPSQVAERLGYVVSAEAITMLLSGASQEPSMALHAKAVRTFAVDGYWLAFGEGEMVSKDGFSPEAVAAAERLVDLAGKRTGQALGMHVVEALEKINARDPARAEEANRLAYEAIEHLMFPEDRPQSARGPRRRRTTGTTAKRAHQRS